MTDAPDGSRVPVKGPISDFARINLNNRAVTIVFDSNIYTNRNVYWERIHLAKYLRDKPRYARVSFVDIPAEEGINGVDDLIAAWGKDRVLELITERAYDSERQKNGVDRDEWEGSFRRPNWPNPLDPAAFYGLAGEVIRIIEPHSEADPAALLVQLLVAFGNLIGRRAHFRAEADRHFLNLFTVIVGQTSKGRKGSSLGQVQYFLQSVDSKWSLERVVSGLSTGEGLIWAVRDPVYKSVPVKENGRTIGREVGWSPELRQTVKTLLTVRQKRIDRRDDISAK